MVINHSHPCKTHLTRDVPYSVRNTALVHAQTHTHSTTKAEPAAVQCTGPQIITPPSEEGGTFHFPLQKLCFILVLHTLAARSGTQLRCYCAAGLWEYHFPLVLKSAAANPLQGRGKGKGNVFCVQQRVISYTEELEVLFLGNGTC